MVGVCSLKLQCSHGRKVNTGEAAGVVVSVGGGVITIATRVYITP